MKTVGQIAAVIPGAKVIGSSATPITYITCDSRQVTPGSLFICLPGTKIDGHVFLTEAYRRGAVAAIISQEVDIPGLTKIHVSDCRAAMQLAVPYYYDYPGQRLKLIGVTGTNGKTTTTYLLRKILRDSGNKVGVIGTIQVWIEDEALPVKNTTPDVAELQELLARMAAAGMEYVIMEVSSHALALGRIAGCSFCAAVFTNLTRDHLDFHGTMEEYLQAKLQLFAGLTRTGSSLPPLAVINADDPVAERFVTAAAGCRVVRYSLQKPAELMAENISIGPRGMTLSLVGMLQAKDLHLRITGLFNVYNSLAALATAVGLGTSGLEALRSMETFDSVAGRFELVDEGQPFSVIVDYAHTPDGLENILRTAKEFVTRRLIIVFGCGGDRDRTKRPIMGQLAAKYADIIIATSDNPRSEDPAGILEEIETGIRQELSPEKQYKKILDRRQAIAWAIQIAEPADVIIIAGKGHETYQILQDRTIDFDDRQVARECIKEWGK